MTSRAFFFSARGSLRAPWRIAGFFVATLAALAVVGTAGAALLPLSGHVMDMLTWSSCAMAVALLAGHVLMLRLVDREPWSEVGLGRADAAPSLLARGWLLGAVAIGVPCAVLLALGLLRAVPTPGDGAGWWRFTASMSLALLPAALWEELLFRGYVFSVLRRAIGTPWALAASSIVFGAVHRSNDPGAGWMPLALVALAGFFLGGVLLATRSLYAAWMAHFAWNWVMAVLVHTEVSGIPLAPPLYRVTERGPDWVTGGTWGPEGGLPAGAGMLLIIAYLVARSRRRGELP